MATIGDTAANVTWEVQQGADIDIGFSLQQTDGTVPDFTGYTAIVQVAQTYGGTVLLEASTATRPDGTTGNGRITCGLYGTAPNQWNVQMQIDHGATGALSDWGVGVWDLWVADTAGNEKPMMRGPAYLARKVGR